MDENSTAMARGPILVVDDEAWITELLTRLLTSRDFDVHTARDGSEALRQVDAHDYRLILLDLRMPGMDGIECLRQLKAQGCQAEIMMVTGYGDIPTAVEAISGGALDFIEKPFQPDELLAKIEETIARQNRKSAPHHDPVVAYIQQHSTKIGSRKDVAEHLGISLEQVSKRIQTHTSQTFRQFLHNCRLETAKQLLQTTDLDVSQISQRTGFQTVQHFSRVFRQYAGIPPQQYRLKSRAQT
jgi:YesN/AraC family two-component response regulator